LANTAPALTIAERQHIERVLGVGRVALCAAALVSLLSTPSGLATRTQLTVVVLCGYAAFGALALAAAAPRRTHALPPRVTHGVDFGAATALTLISAPSPNPFFLLFLFTLLAAAYRWGLRETLMTALAAVLVLWVSSVDGQELLMRSTYLITAAFLIGWLAESELQRRAEVEVVSDALSRLQGETGVHAAMREMSRRLIALFEADQLLAVVHDPRTGAAHVWSARMRPAGPDVRVREIGAKERAQYFFSAPGEAWEVRRTARGEQAGLALGHRGQWLGDRNCDVPDTIWGDSAASALAGVEVSFAGQWSGRVFMLRDRPLGGADLAFFRELICRIAPAMFSLYLVQRLRARVSAAERARVARELHDGVIQSLAGVRFDVAALRRHAERGLPIEAELGRLEHVLAEQVVATRELMHRIRPVEVTPRQLPSYLGTLVERFTRETGIPAHYHTDIEATDLSPRTCRELARTLQEALVNVRKHSAAGHVVVRFSADPIHYRLTIDNDGRPFEFAGRLTLAELESARRGPLVIKERVRAMGGELVIESSSDRGVRLDILLRRPKSAGGSKIA
jgi:signal transduction histidine kinase